MHLVLPLQQLESFFGRQFDCVAIGYCPGAAGYAGGIAGLGQPPDDQERRVFEALFSLPVPLLQLRHDLEMVLLRRRRAYQVQRNQSGLGLYSARLAGGNKDDGSGMDSLLDVACHDLPIALQDQQSHIDAGCGPG